MRKLLPVASWWARHDIGHIRPVGHPPRRGHRPSDQEASPDCPPRRARRRCCITPSAPSISSAQFPGRPIRLLLPAQPGGPGDAFMRAACAIASHRLGHPVVVDYRPGAGAARGAARRPHARCDAGHRVPHAAARAVAGGLDPRTDFTWVIQLAGLLIGLVVRAASPWQSFREFLDHARTNPGRTAYGIPGANSTELPSCWAAASHRR
jgi:tripartite-type tricarboxylate transporter receptor subunit TctC